MRFLEYTAEFRVALKKLLCQRFPGAQVSEANDASAAMLAAGNAVPDVLIFDLEADPFGSASVVNLVRRAGDGVIVIALSGYAYLEYQQAASDRSADLFFCKSADGFADDMIRGMERCFTSHAPLQ
jgi:DNA-binding NarL/FixJ family response regulator